MYSDSTGSTGSRRIGSVLQESDEQKSNTSDTGSKLITFPKIVVEAIKPSLAVGLQNLSPLQKRIRQNYQDKLAWFTGLDDTPFNSDYNAAVSGEPDEEMFGLELKEHMAKINAVPGSKDYSDHAKDFLDSYMGVIGVYPIPDEKKRHYDLQKLGQFCVQSEYMAVNYLVGLKHFDIPAGELRRKHKNLASRVLSAPETRLNVVVKKVLSTLWKNISAMDKKKISDACLTVPPDATISTIRSVIEQINVDFLTTQAVDLVCQKVGGVRSNPKYPDGLFSRDSLQILNCFTEVEETHTQESDDDVEIIEKRKKKKKSQDKEVPEELDIGSQLFHSLDPSTLPSPQSQVEKSPSLSLSLSKLPVYKTSNIVSLPSETGDTAGSGGKRTKKRSRKAAGLDSEIEILEAVPNVVYPRNHIRSFRKLINFLVGWQAQKPMLFDEGRALADYKLSGDPNLGAMYTLAINGVFANEQRGDPAFSNEEILRTVLDGMVTEFEDWCVSALREVLQEVRVAIELDNWKQAGAEKKRRKLVDRMRNYNKPPARDDDSDEEMDDEDGDDDDDIARRLAQEKREEQKRKELEERKRQKEALEARKKAEASKSSRKIRDIPLILSGQEERKVETESEDSGKQNDEAIKAVLTENFLGTAAGQDWLRQHPEQKERIAQILGKAAAKRKKTKFELALARLEADPKANIFDMNLGIDDMMDVYRAEKSPAFKAQKLKEILRKEEVKRKGFGRKEKRRLDRLTETDKDESAFSIFVSKPTDALGVTFDETRTPHIRHSVPPMSKDKKMAVLRKLLNERSSKEVKELVMSVAKGEDMELLRFCIRVLFYFLFFE